MYGSKLSGWAKNLQKRPGAMDYAHSTRIPGYKPKMPSYQGGFSLSRPPADKLGIRSPKFGYGSIGLLGSALRK